MVLETTGERFIPETMGGQLIEAEHVVRYALAAQVASGRRVLDAGCGVGWGSAVLLAAGAAGVAGLDLSEAAIIDARQRMPGAVFVQGDLARLPWDDGAFDLVVCFEALEHVVEQEQTLDELVRVLAPEGLLAVSSPNPRVYPEGNPFHVHELTPEALVEAVGRRLACVELWHQHSQIASVLVRGPSLTVGKSCDALVRAVRPLEAGSDPYSLVLGARCPLPVLPPNLCLAPSSQLLHLEAASALLAEERERMAVDQRRVREEREMLLAEHRRMESENEYLRRERERVGILLLESEQELAIARASAATSRDGLDHQRQVETLEGQLVVAQRELADLRNSTSWRLTAPLRAVGARLSRRR